MDRTVGQDDRIVELKANWAAQLRVTCALLSRPSSYTIKTISITNTLTIASNATADLETLSTRLAQEYGLTAQVQFGDDSVTVYLRRDDKTGEGERAAHEPRRRSSS